MNERVGMVEISRKPHLYRESTAKGKIYLKEDTIKKIRKKEIKKGDVFSVAATAATLAVKKTPEIIPLCHPIPITGVDVDFDVSDNFIEAKVRVKNVGQTGVEMESLVGVTTALLTIWDMVKYLEKENSQYPYTKISEVIVLEKIKGG
ncbi:MAG: cyclic pyranopterin monophosphate synthase MoaC [Candidatus Hydrothermarchaeota archaeon]